MTFSRPGIIDATARRLRNTALDGGGCSASGSCRFPPKNNPRQFHRRLDRAHSRSGRFEEEVKSLSLPTVEPRFVGLPFRTSVSALATIPQLPYICTANEV
jgi:hypothetical protein